MAELRASIEAHGVQVPIIVDEHGNTIDGHHRQKLAAELGIEYPREVREGLSDDEKRMLALTLNTKRRMLTPEQIREVIGKALHIAPERSDRHVAADLRVDHKTVASVRREQEDVGKLPHIEKRIDTQGRRQPATKPTAVSTPARKPSKPKAPPPVVERVVPPPELREPLAEFDAVVKAELDKLERVTYGKPAAYALRRVCNRLRAAVSELLRAAKAGV
ncbi:ParB N-terminal domain-containing protein [Paraburkholderia diazotrophica]